MTAIPRSHKIFYGVICAAALLIGFLGYFAPARLAEITSWLTLPPLHARFVGALDRQNFLAAPVIRALFERT